MKKILFHCTVGFLLATFAALGPSTKQIAAREPAGALHRILLVASQPDHPWASHMYEQECRLLGKCLENVPGVRAEISVGWPADLKQTQDIRAVVFYCKHAGDILLSEPHREQCERLLKEGAGLTAIHWSTGADVKYGPEYLNLLGGWFNRAHSGIKIGDAQLIKVDPKHPICNGWKGWPIHDEFYLNLRFHKDARPLLTVNVDGKEQVVGWTFQRPDSNGGRSFGTTLGHFHDNFAREDFRRMLVNGILWTAHVEVPAEGADVRVDEQFVKLPPKPAEAK
jgi:type 1 glutamine amidotransferase